jgi:hypothetical protein
MTGTKTHTIRKAEVITTATVYPTGLHVSITIDLSALDADLPSHSPHQLINYVRLPSTYETRKTYWWCKLHRDVRVRTGSQARRVIKHALDKIDDAVSAAVIARNARIQELSVALS